MIRTSAFISLLFCSVFIAAISIWRMLYSHDGAYLYMNVNLALAWIPFFMSLYIRLLKRNQQVLMLLASFLWLLFYPNTFYLVTDFIHLKERPLIPFWFDAGMLTVFALLGIILGYLSLHMMEQLLRKRIQHELFSVTILLVTSFGIFLGRVLRWNSWDIFFRPTELGVTIIQSLSKPSTWAFTVGTAIVLIAGYYVLRPKFKYFFDN